MLQSSLILLKNQKSYLNLKLIKHILLMKNIIKFIEGQRDMSEWDSFIKEAKDKDLDKVVKAYNDAYDRKKLEKTNNE